MWKSNTLKYPNCYCTLCIPKLLSEIRLGIKYTFHCFIGLNIVLQKMWYLCIKIYQKKNTISAELCTNTTQLSFYAWDWLKLMFSAYHSLYKSLSDGSCHCYSFKLVSTTYLYIHNLYPCSKLKWIHSTVYILY